jgi:nitrilase
MGQSDTDKVARREADGHGPIQEFLAGQAREHRIWLVGGTLPLIAPEPQRVMNSVLVFDPEGSRVARYDKIHLFRFTKGTETYDEAQTIAPGRQVSTFEFAPDGGPRLRSDFRLLRLTVPELYRVMQRPDLILVPAALPRRRAAPTGKSWCARGRSRTWPTCSRRPRAAGTKMAA